MDGINAYRLMVVVRCEAAGFHGIKRGSEHNQAVTAKPRLALYMLVRRSSSQLLGLVRKYGKLVLYRYSYI